MSKETFYFSHDYNSRSDGKIKKLLSKTGMQGYGIYWSLVEDLYQNANALPLDCDCIAFDLHTEPELVKQIIEDFGLFVIEDTEFGSLSIQKRMDKRDEKSGKAREAALKRWSMDAAAMQTHSDSSATAMQVKESKEEEKKLKDKKIKERERRKFIAPSLNEVIEFFEEKGYTIDSAKQAYEYYDTANWKDSTGKQVLNWKQKMLAVWFKDENKQPAKYIKPY